MKFATKATQLLGESTYLNLSQEVVDFRSGFRQRTHFDYPLGYGATL
ncbi:hypothetical protein [Idiomarina piscisalsi]|nr:hypothetical protein [Idiomarina piscisalsi]